MKKAIFLILLLVLFNPYALNAEQIEMKDIKGTWAEADIYALITRSIISGNPDGTYKPSDSVTRGQFVKMLVCAMNMELQDGNSFEDLGKNWSRRYVETALKNGIINKSEIGNVFRPEEPLKRIDMAYMLVRALHLAPSYNKSSFCDLQESDGIVIKLCEKKLIVYYEEEDRKYFKPGGLCTRAEAAVIIKRFLEYSNIDALGKLPSIETSFNYIYLEDMENEVLELVNTERIKAGLMPLTEDKTLRLLARYKSNEMLQLGYFSHKSPRNDYCDNLADKVDYRFQNLGENIIEAKDMKVSAKIIVENWMNSPTHRKNILNKNYNRIGIGIEFSEDAAKTTGTQIFSD